MVGRSEKWLESQVWGNDGPIHGTAPAEETKTGEVDAAPVDIQDGKSRQSCDRALMQSWAADEALRARELAKGDAHM